jgi:hypothetical protein
VNFEATVNGTSPTGADNLKSVWLTYTTGPSGCSCWQSVDLTRTAGTNKFTGSATIAAGDQSAMRFLVQAANAAAMVGVEDNDGAYYSLANAKEVVAVPATTTLHMGSVPASGAYGATIPVSATLTDGSGPLSGRVISFRIGTAIGYGTTNGSGVASTTLQLLATPGTQQIAAAFAGEDDKSRSDDTANIDVSSLATTITLTLGSPGLPGDPSGVTATLKAGSTPLAGRTITFVGTGTAGSALGNGFVKSVTTDANGVGALGPIPATPVGWYSIKVSFSGTIDLHPWGAPAASITLTDPIYGASSATASPMKVIWPFTGFFSPVDASPIVNVAKAGSTVPVKFKLGGDRGMGILNGEPRVVKLASCGSGAQDVLEEQTTSNNGLVYDPSSQQYQYNWKTAKTLVGCYRLDVVLMDGQTYNALFQFK